MDPDRFLTRSSRDPRVGRILAAALEAVEPGKIVREHLEHNPIPGPSKIHLLGIGKAALPMTSAAAKSLDHFIDGLAITKQAFFQADERIQVVEAGHPIPDRRSLEAGRAALRFVSRLQHNEQLICLLSGGGSALVTLPKPGIRLEDLQQLTNDLLRCGATIREINILRRELDQIKGGGLASATQAPILNLVLSDVIGDDLASIASGPTVPNPTTQVDAMEVLKKYHLTPADSIQRSLSKQTTNNQKAAGGPVKSYILGNNLSAVQAAARQAKAEGFHPQILELALNGEASQTGRRLAKQLREAAANVQRPFCRILGGETTVTLRGNGKGGRNQELALAAVDELSGLRGVTLISLASDGNDGPTEAAGAVVTGETGRRAKNLGMAAEDFLARNDAYSFFDPLGDLLKPGYTGTNVNDLVFLFGF